MSVAPIFTFTFVPTIPMVSMPFDINLEKNAHGTFAVEVSDASASNEVGRVTDIFPQESQNKRQRYKNVRLTNIAHTNTTGYRAYLKTVMNTLHTFQSISATQLVRLQSISENSDELSSHISEHICYSTEAQKTC